MEFVGFLEGTDDLHELTQHLFRAQGLCGVTVHRGDQSLHSEELTAMAARFGDAVGVQQQAIPGLELFFCHGRTAPRDAPRWSWHALKFTDDPSGTNQQRQRVAGVDPGKDSGREFDSSNDPRGELVSHGLRDSRSEVLVDLRKRQAFATSVPVAAQGQRSYVSGRKAASDRVKDGEVEKITVE